MSVARERPRREPRTGHERAWFAGAVGIIALVALGIWAYARTRPGTAEVARRDIVAALNEWGEVIAPPGARADVMAPYRAPVARVLTSVGANVRRGDVVVELSHPTAQAAFEQARQALRAAETAYANAKRLHSAEVKAAAERLTAARDAEKAAREALQAQVAPSADSTVLPTPAPSSDLQAALQARMEAEQALTAAKARRDAALLPYRQQLEAAQLAFREAQEGRKMAMIRAPISGTVLALNAQPGKEVGTAPKDPVATIVDLDALQTLVELKQEEAAQVKAGMPARLTVEGMPSEQFRGGVEAITTEPPRPLRGPRYVAVVKIENKRGLIKPGMKAQVSITTGEVKDALAVPNHALRRDRTGRPVVRVLRDGQWREVVVETGLSDGVYTEVRSGLNQGETVQVRPKLVRT